MVFNNVPLEPYTFRSIRFHLARVLELLRTSGPHDALKEGRSPSVLDTLTNTQITGTYAVAKNKRLMESVYTSNFVYLLIQTRVYTMEKA